MRNSKPLIYTSTRGMSRQDWLRFRDNGIGASEIGVILGLSQYKSNVELYYEKLSPRLQETPENMPMFMGTELEAFVADKWQYWGGSEASMIENYRAGNKLRKMQRVNAYIQNPDYPQLFVSLDRKILRHPDGKGVLKGNGALEVKTISGYEAEKWEGGVPPSHVVQVQTQLMVTRWKYGELAVLKDGRMFDVYPFEYHAGVCREINKQSKEFWGRVLQGRKLLTQQYEAKVNFNTRKVLELEAELQRLEPNADGSDGLAKFLKDKYQNAEPKSERSGTDEELLLAQEHAQLKEKEKKVAAGVQLAENSLKVKMKEIERLTFGEAGSVYWKNDVNGARRFVNKLKPG